MPLDAGLEGKEELVCAAAAQALGIPVDLIAAVRVAKRSVDARRKRDVHFVATLVVELADAALEERMVAGSTTVQPGVSVKRSEPYSPLAVPDVSEALGGFGESRPVVVGTGPAGLFCALYLARAGLRPLVLERGGDVEERRAAVASFNAGGDLDLSTNIQFGAGGAGTFSDGKLTTNTKSPLSRHVLRWFVDAGAPQEILWQAKPHIGTDNLVRIVHALCGQIEEAGGEVRFHAQLTGLAFDDEGRVSAVEVSDGAGCFAIPARQVVLACGHSARDTFAMLHEAGVVLEQKPFSVGVRIEHPQAAVNRAQYGETAAHPALGAADYKLAVHLPVGEGKRAVNRPLPLGVGDGLDGGWSSSASADGRGVYTFCMCPGGEVVCAASEEGGVVVNGMSRFARDGQNANSALLVGVEPSDFGSDHPLAGVELQRAMERAAFACAIAAGGRPYQAPAQTVGDFLAHRAGTPSKTVHPTYARGVAWCDLHECLPPFVAGAMERALPLLDRKLAGFADPQAVMTGVETRSSSPVRIVRDDTLQARVKGCAPEGGSVLFPCGEGAGYAGGIMSAACDGLKVAQAIVDAYR